MAISEFPSNIDAAAVALTVGSTNAFSQMRTTVLITTDEAVKAMEKAGTVAGSYEPPSS